MPKIKCQWKNGFGETKKYVKFLKQKSGIPSFMRVKFANFSPARQIPRSKKNSFDKKNLHRGKTWLNGFFLRKFQRIHNDPPIYDLRGGVKKSKRRSFRGVRVVVSTRKKKITLFIGPKNKKENYDKKHKKEPITGKHGKVLKKNQDCKLQMKK